MPPSKKQKVFWTDEEIEIIARRAVEVSLRDVGNIWMYVAKAQGDLPSNRRRTIIGKAGVTKRLIERFCEFRNEILETGVPVPVPYETRIVVQPSRKELLTSITTEELFALLVGRLAPIVDMLPKLLDRSVVQPTSVAPREVPRQTAETSETVSRKPRVLIFGFLKKQADEIERRAKSFNLDLMFQNKENRKQDPPPSCHWCVSLRMISHSASEKITKALGNDRFYLVNGIEKAVETLANINSRVGTGVL